VQPSGSALGALLVGHIARMKPQPRECHTETDLRLPRPRRRLTGQIGTMSFFTCDAEEEQEATWLAGCFLLPRELPLRSLRCGMDANAIAAANTVSTQMASFRLRTTGVLVRTRCAVH
jgi:hypothetical protein